MVSHLCLKCQLEEAMVLGVLYSVVSKPRSQDNTKEEENLGSG